MLMIWRRKQEKIVVSVEGQKRMVMRIETIGEGRVRLAIDADPSVRITRTDVVEAEQFAN